MGAELVGSCTGKGWTDLSGAMRFFDHGASQGVSKGYGFRTNPPAGLHLELIGDYFFFIDSASDCLTANTWNFVAASVSRGGTFPVLQWSCCWYKS